MQCGFLWLPWLWLGRCGAFWSPCPRDLAEAPPLGRSPTDPWGLAGPSSLQPTTGSLSGPLVSAKTMTTRTQLLSLRIAEVKNGSRRSSCVPLALTDTTPWCAETTEFPYGIEASDESCELVEIGRLLEWGFYGPEYTSLVIPSHPGPSPSFFVDCIDNWTIEPLNRWSINQSDKPHISTTSSMITSAGPCVSTATWAEPGTCDPVLILPQLFESGLTFFDAETTMISSSLSSTSKDLCSCSFSMTLTRGRLFLIMVKLCVPSSKYCDFFPIMAAFSGRHWLSFHLIRPA